MITVMLKLFVIVMYDVSWYFMVSMCVPTIYEELEEKFRIMEPKVVETVT